MTDVSSLESLLSRLRGGLIVSCQALPGEPLHGSDIMARMALAAEAGGAVGIRANTPQDVAAIRSVTKLPIIGLNKVDLPGYEVYITPRLADAVGIAEAGADIVAIDATRRRHPEGETGDFIKAVQLATRLPVLADISTVEEAIDAHYAGAEIVSTTLSGYTSYTPHVEEPDMFLLQLIASIGLLPVIAEGRIATPEQAAAAITAGAHAVVVGGAITRPQLITARFVKALLRSGDPTSPANLASQLATIE